MSSKEERAAAVRVVKKYVVCYTRHLSVDRFRKKEGAKKESAAAMSSKEASVAALSKEERSAAAVWI